jgi:hypothetical protein
VIARDPIALRMDAQTITGSTQQHSGVFSNPSWLLVKRDVPKNRMTGFPITAITRSPGSPTRAAVARGGVWVTRDHPIP